MAEELLQTRREVERQGDVAVRISREKEELTREKANLIVQLTAAERENRAQSEVRRKYAKYLGNVIQISPLVHVLYLCVKSCL